KRERMRAVINFKPLLYLILFQKMGLTRVLGVRAVMKRKRGQRNASFPCGTNSGNGIRSVNGLNCGTSIMGAFTEGKMYAYFPLVIGPSWMSGITFVGKT